TLSLHDALPIFLLGFTFGPGFCAAFTLRPLAISASVQSQSVRPSPNGIPWDGRIFLSSSHRLSVLNDTPIRRAATAVLYVFFMRSPQRAISSTSNRPRQSRTLFRHSLASRAKSGPFPFPPSACQTLSR